jgi:hypothetical protein
MKSAEFIGWALGGLEREITQTRERLSAMTAQAARLRERLGAKVRRSGAQPSAAGEASPAPVARKRRKMSPEARKRMSEMMKKRWAERRRKKA